MACRRKCADLLEQLEFLKLQNYSAALYRRLGQEVDYPINYHVVGSLRLAHTQERMDEFHHARAMARLNGMDYEICNPKKYPPVIHS